MQYCSSWILKKRVIKLTKKKNTLVIFFLNPLSAYVGYDACHDADADVDVGYAPERL